MNDLRFAILGTGFWARYQLAAWNELPGVRCVAVYNRTPSKAEKLAAEFGIPAVYDDPAGMLDHESLDFLDVITDVAVHAPLVVHLAAQRRLPVICQKPMATSLEEAEKMVEACRVTGTLFFVHENWRWQTPIRQLKSVLDSGAIGEPFGARQRGSPGPHGYAGRRSSARRRHRRTGNSGQPDCQGFRADRSSP